MCFVCHERDRLAVPKEVVDLLALCFRVHHNKRAARLEDSPKRDDGFGYVRKPDRNAIARRESARQERECKLSCGLVQLRKGPRAMGHHERDRLGRAKICNFE